MSSNRRQSNLFSFFQKKPKDEPAEAVPEISELEVGRENVHPPSTQKSSLLAHNNSTPKASPAMATAEEKKQQQATPLRWQGPQRLRSTTTASALQTPGAIATVLVDMDDEDSRGVGFMSCTSATSSSARRATPPPTKRRRVILSSDDDEEEEDDGGDANQREEKEEVVKKKRREDDVEKATTTTASPTPAEGRVQTQQQKQQKRAKIEVEGTHDFPAAVKSTPKHGPSSSSTPSTSAAVGAFAQSFIDSFSVDAAGDASDCSLTVPTKGFGGRKSEKCPATTMTEQNDDDGGERFPHLDFEFLKSDKIKDAKGRRPDNEEYDPRTLFVPEHFLKSQTPGHKQWWKLKSEHFDTVLFFKVGKFYELFHMDAVIAVENLGLTYMRGKIAHCGFPEIGYGRFADQLVNRGYNVARIEQTETPQQLADRQNTKSIDQEREKVVRREICRITTPGTKTYGVQDGTDARELDGTTDPNPSYLMALTEKLDKSGCIQFGVCFVDCSIGMFRLSQFEDDTNQSNLRTLLAHNFPAQLLYEKGALSAPTMGLLNTMLSTVPKEALFPKRQFRTAESTLSMLCDDNYLGANSAIWPEAIRTMLASPGAAAVPSPSEQHKLCLSALGAVIWYLKQCLVDVDTVSMRHFSKYIPPSTDALTNCENSVVDNLDRTNFWKGKHMILDGISLINLHIVPSLSTFGVVPPPPSSIAGGNNRLNAAAFSLYNTVCRCQTAFGKRLLRQWVSAPTCDREALARRQAAIKCLFGDQTMRPLVPKMEELLRRIPDLERLFQRIHTNGLKYRSDAVNGHPDSRAQLFEADKYSKRKIRDLLIVLDGLEEVQKLMRLFNGIDSSTKMKMPTLLNECLTGNYTSMKEDLTHFMNAFDPANALERGVILPHKGVDDEYDGACRDVDGCKMRLAGYLSAVGKKLKCAPKYFGTGKNAYQLEIPDAVCKSIPDNFQLTSQRKGFKRYTTPDLQKLVNRLGDAESQCAAISAEVTRRVFADLDARKNKWAAVVHQMATFDCLLSLASYAQSSAQKMSFPEFVFDSGKSFIDIQRGYHPSLVDTKSTTTMDFNYIPNSCVLGGEQKSAHTMLLTGPNMGGKSTLMRQVASLVVLAQIGSMVPADSMRLTPVDRIFCRIGASDRLSAGQSTFFVELSETNTILRRASRHSLVLIDELGRGTSTHDGTAIACAVLKHIARNIGCRTLFSTHYHSLCKFVEDEPSIGLAHMACMVENADLEDPTMDAITFLYTLADGMCDKSYGFYTAKVAGLSTEVVRKAFQASNQLLSQNVKAKEG